MFRRASLVLALTCIFLSTWSAATMGREPKVPNWEASCADGSIVDLHSALAEGPVIVSFWALWCKPCLKELPHLDKLDQDFQGELTVLAVNIDSQRSVARVSPFLHSKGYNLKVPLDTAGDISRLMQVGGAVPFLVLLDSDGREIYRHSGYKEGDEIILRHEVQALLAENKAGSSQVSTPDQTGAEDKDRALEQASGDKTNIGSADQVAATDQLEYSYSTETEREIFENWLDVSYYIAGFRTGLLLDSQQPSEEHTRDNSITHRFFEFSSGGSAIRVGHFYGLFGRGLLFSAYEDRLVRVDTALDGIIASVRKGRLRARVFSGTPSARELDIRGLDTECDLGRGLILGGSGLTYLAPAPIGIVNREWVASARIHKRFSWGECYLEQGWKKGYDFQDVLDDQYQAGKAFYGSLNVFAGPFSLALEAKDYDRFAVLRRADGKVNLNNPPSLTREHQYTLLSRNTHNMDPDDEVGGQAELTWTGPSGWRAEASANRTEDQEGNLLFEEAYGHLQKEALGRYRIRGACGYQDVTLEHKGINRFIIGEFVWNLDETRSVTIQVEHQHTELGPRDRTDDLGGILYPGVFDTQLYILEFAVAPHWTFASLFETNNKVLPEQQTEPGEKEGPFPAATVSYTTSSSGIYSVWIGKRQAGQVCTGGVCKREPAFEGVELFWVLRY